MTETKSVTVVTPDPAAVMPVLDIGTAVARRNQMVDFVRQIMVEGNDYGIIPGTGNKNVLLKAGAEKLTTFFGLTKRFSILEKAENWDKPFFYYHYRCHLHRGELLIAEGDGSCNSHETKYRYRQADRKCPNCGKATIIKGRAEYGGGWLCFAKKGGCGAKFADDDPVITAQQIGRVENPDIADQVNTIQKMAMKRALVAATLMAVNASEFFTQDLEDIETVIGEVVEATSKTAEPLVQPADADLPVAEHHNDLPMTGPEFLAWLNEQRQDPFDNLYELRNALANDGLEGKGWPPSTKTEWWQRAAELALAHVRKHK